MFSFESFSIAHVLAFITAALLTFALIELLLSFRGPEHKRIQRRLEESMGFSEEGADTVIKQEETKWAMARWLAASRRGMSFRKLCYQAALPWEAHLVLAGISFIVVFVLVVSLLVDLRMVTTMSLALVGGFLPFAAIIMARNQRMKKFNTQLPEVLELLSQCLRAGHSLQAGFQLVAEQLPDPVGAEFGRVHSEQGLGIPLEEALDHLAERIDLLDLRMFVTAVHIQRQTGGDLTELMGKLGAVIRDRMTILGQVRALTAEGRLSGMILVLLPVFVLLVLFILQPEHPQFFLKPGPGRYMAVVAVIMQILGIVFIRRIVNVKV